MKHFTATVSSQGQFTIPVAIRQQLGIKPGDRVVLAVADGAIVLTPLRESIVAQTAGSLGKYARRHR